ncbi:MAG: EAL domain-containing protein, partial [Pseudomonadota bacterium]
EGAPAGTLVYAPAQPYQSHMSLFSVAALIIFVTGFATMVMYYIARQAASSLDDLTRLISSVSLNGFETNWGPSLSFAEFRRLRLSAERTTRRLGQELTVLRRRAEIDDRTGLFNQYYLKSSIDRCLETAGFDKPSALILINIDGLADLSAELGGTRYLALLKMIGGELLATSRAITAEMGSDPDSWVLACLPSDQFAFLASGFESRDDIAPIVRRIHAHFREMTTFEDVQLSLKASGSIVMVPEDGDTQAIIVQRAEATLQSLRSDGAAGFRFYSPKLERQNESRRKLETELRKAVEDERFVPLFQPKIDMKTGRICGVEALARWQLDSGRLVSPAVFIGLAEEIGLIDKIGRQIMHLSCDAVAAWARAGHELNLAVNVSPRQFEADGLAEMVLEALANSGLSPRRLELEITESLAIEQPERVRTVLTPLRRMGIGLAVDDFGTGHSNLAILTQFEFDVFKIDRQFVSGLPNDTQAAAIIDLMLGMARSLDMKIVGEGIETKAQARFMADKGCDIGQGYLYSPPVGEAALLKMLEAQAELRARRSA